MQKSHRNPFNLKNNDATNMEPLSWWFRTPGATSTKAAQTIRRDRHDWCYRKLVKNSND